jgi:hypothetical protein
MPLQFRSQFAGLRLPDAHVGVGLGDERAVRRHRYRSGLLVAATELAEFLPGRDIPEAEGPPAAPRGCHRGSVGRKGEPIDGKPLPQANGTEAHQDLIGKRIAGEVHPLGGDWQGSRRLGGLSRWGFRWLRLAGE